MAKDYLYAVEFYLVFLMFAPIGLVAARPFIENFRSAYALSKLLGLLLFGYSVWLLSSLRILDFQNIFFVRILFTLAAAASIYALWKYWPREWRNILKNTLTVEAFWIFFYFLYLWLRSHNAEIHGTERFMDMALFKASSMTNYFPPIDPWRAGSPINYYYYGHYLFSIISNLSGVAANYAYNFTLGIIFSSALMLAWAFVRRFTNSKLFASLAAFFVVAAGTIAFGICVIKTSGACSYVKSTRLYEPSYIINEMPSYSFTVGDLHAHLIALPFFLLALFFLYELFERKKINYILIGLVSLILASLGLINPWDFVSLALIVFLIAVFRIIRTKEKEFLAKALSLGIISVILMLPFLLRFESGASRIGFSPFYASEHALLTGYQYPTPLSGWLGIWSGFIAILAICFLMLRDKIWNTKNFPFLMFLTAGLLLAGVELFFIKDIYSLANPPYFRANTVFKFGFHTWTLLSLAAMILSAKAIREYKLKWALPIIISILFFLGLFYPVKAINEFYLSSKTSRTLDGALFLKTFYPNDYAAINWLDENVRERKVIIEAAGDSYKEFGRISVFSGMINPINWLTHEWGWHFKPEGRVAINSKVPQESGWGKVAAVSGDVRQIYESNDPEETRILLEKYGAEFIYIGDLERKEYPNLSLEKFYKLGQIAFSSGNSKLFRLSFRTK
ncbi:MAG: YYY membrane protein [Candidatus Giovannonibacteria bacterium GW2011_GWB1_45_9b]|uniref:YYY membrane protein n=7 Tax=Candidatus Giovannoniibacteriota TaxID=1752738 RepID=A0A1F5WXT5_9BACT|nr:MAG: YYY membrane protein [Candidatus Giovannonibacteria bacterium GW2011_GWC2_44_8]KKU04359.1 MAG: YYY membrane protein [Candidatus Giovannonibacteria bacterium GW2011_GWA2_45_21]KKU16671.1 MAG: YYY membrane protein [Candidatus Giovannonibacteria bacterium GW2011_GWB1_45_9b]OGF73341.1 MAG: hypothetical protein A2W57_03800 [Candidatus Giovannonibacteria bacterium RIFCSPHIGHO2_02_43_16]OGF80439.1 MAG: hypothetical protein A2W48_01515 [Candidatus Giovannonibacteria bacterium RIFCSPHIGHO2_12_44